MSESIAEVDHEVLSTLAADGTRRWMNPRPSQGRFQRARAVVGWGLIATFATLPWITVGGKPLLLLDLAKREFTFGGHTLFATDTLVLMLFLLGMFATVFLLTAVFGRVWCGWGCPQTVYLEFVFRPVERLILGRAAGRHDAVPFVRRLGLWGAYLVIALLMAHTFLAYFVPVGELWHWVRGSPGEHLQSFLVVAAVTGLIFVDFVYFREQMCTLACPYGRLQSVLLDKNSLLVGYDAARGEPRGKPRAGTTTGDCIDCKACVATCPTGIDIRKGLQMECIACTQCIDACDTIMAKLNRAPGLIRYATQTELSVLEEQRAAGQTLCAPKRTFLRPRLLVYSVLVVGAFTALAIVASGTSGVELTVLRDRVTPFQVMDGGLISNQLHMKIKNRTGASATFEVSIPDLPDARIISADLPCAVETGTTRTVNLVVLAPKSAFHDGKRKIELVVSDGTGPRQSIKTHLIGPEAEEDHE